ncbi:MAG: hypothetical protein WD081_01920 [Gammaproteobacteria bacterium]
MDMYRNQVMFRVIKPHGFVSLEPSGAALDALSEPDPLVEIEQIFEEAREEAFGVGSHRVDMADDVMSILEDLLESRSPVDRGAENKTKRFFELVVGKLNQAGDDDRAEAVSLSRM